MKLFDFDFLKKRKAEKELLKAKKEEEMKHALMKEEEAEKEKLRLEKEEQLKSDTPLVKHSNKTAHNDIKIWRPRPIDVEKSFASDEILVSKTDTRGNIAYGNELFVKLSGYSQDELLGQPHSIIRHPDMPKIIFKALWDTISQGKEINAYVVNLAKGGEYYWVYANVTPSFNREGSIIGYYSVRRKPNPAALDIIKPLYHDLKKAEVVGGIHESTKVLTKLLTSKGLNYEELIFRLQYNSL